MAVVDPTPAQTASAGRRVDVAGHEPPVVPGRRVVDPHGLLQAHEVVAGELRPQATAYGVVAVDVAQEGQRAGLKRRIVIHEQARPHPHAPTRARAGLGHRPGAADPTEGHRPGPEVHALALRDLALVRQRLGRRHVEVGLGLLDDERLRTVYEACEALVEKSQGISLITLRHYLEEHGLLDRIGGVSFLADLAAFTPTAAHIEHHAAVVREKALARSLIRSCESIASRGYDGTTPIEDLLEEAEREVMQIAMGHVDAGFVPIKAELESTFEHIEQLQQAGGGVTGVPSGFPDLDRLTSGFQRSDLIVVAGRPSMGKTSIVLNFIQHAAIECGTSVAFFSLEMAKEAIARAAAERVEDGQSVLLDSGTTTLALAKVLRDRRGLKVGVLNVTMFRPFPADFITGLLRLSSNGIFSTLFSPNRASSRMYWSNWFTSQASHEFARARNPS